MNLGDVSKQADGFMVKLERVLPYPIETVWDAITNPKKLRVWFAQIEMEFKTGGKMAIHFEDKDKTVSHGKILRIEKPSVFEFSWEEELAVWELFPEGASRTRLVLTYSKLPDSYAISVVAGWHQLLDQLEEVLNGRTEPYPFGAGQTPAGKVLNERYREILLKRFPELNPPPSTDTPVVVERTFDVSREIVWEAITNKEKMKQWYFDLPEFKAEVGFEFEFWAGQEEGKKWHHQCKITAVVPYSKIAYTWKYPGYAGESLVSMELFEENGKTRFRLTHSGLDSFPKDVPELEKKNFEEGWTAIIGQSLDSFLLQK